MRPTDGSDRNLVVFFFYLYYIFWGKQDLIFFTKNKSKVHIIFITLSRYF